MKLSLFDYKLPKSLIAQAQIKPRDKSRLMIIDRVTKKISHDFFYNLPQYLDKGDVVVFNDSRVIPARIRIGNKEIFLLKDLGKGSWEVIGKKLKSLDGVEIAKGLECLSVERLSNGNWKVKFNLKGKKFRDILECIGETPLPPYIKVEDSAKIKRDYQTMYAKTDGSVAAPTAGLHFTKKVFDRLKKKGVKTEFVTLHVGLGTFAPVKEDTIEKHKMHAEYADLDKSTVKRLNKYKKEGRRVVAVGTTSCRVLEAMSDSRGRLKAGRKWVNIFIYPGYKFRFVDSMITNFHLPKSTLLMLISALAGRKFILRAYRDAIKKEYRFYSFGDSMMIR